MNNTITIGKIAGPHGIKGEMKVMPMTDDPGRFYDLETVTILRETGQETYAIELVRLHKGKVLLTLSGITDRNQVEELTGALITISRNESVALEADEYFITDLIGLSVIDQKGTVIGEISDILKTSGAVDTVEIQTKDKPLYVPARKLYFKDIDFDKRQVTAEIPGEFYTL